MGETGIIVVERQDSIVPPLHPTFGPGQYSRRPTERGQQPVPRLIFLRESRRLKDFIIISVRQLYDLISHQRMVIG